MIKDKALKDRLNRFFEFFKKHSDLIGYILLLIFFVCMNYKMYTVMDYLIDSDMSAELVLAKILASEGRLMTRSWFYSSEIRVLNTNLVFAPLFLITDNWHTVRIAGIVILDLILFISFYYLAKQLNIKHIPWIAFFIVSGFSKDYLLFVTLGSFYIPHFAISFFSLGLFLSILRDENKKTRIVKLIILLVLAFAAGLEGMRLVSICYLPLVAASVLWCFFKEFDHLKEGKFNFKESSLKLVYLSVLVFAVSYIGNICNYNVLAWKLNYIFKLDGNDISYIAFDFNRIGQIVDSIFDVFGYQSDNLFVFSKYQLILKPLFAVYLLVVIWAGVEILVNRKKYSKDEVFIDLYYIVALLIICALFVFTSTPLANRYFLPVTVFSTFVIGVYFTHHSIDWQKWSLIICITFFAVFNTFFLIGWQKENNRYDVKNLITVKDILLDNECYNGYCIDHWNGHAVLTEYSDGVIETWKVYDGDVNSISAWLQPVSHTSRRPEGKVFFLIRKSEIEEELVHFKKDPSEYLYFEDDIRYLFIFNDMNQLLEVVND